MKHVAFAVVVLLYALSAEAADHMVRLQVNCGGDTMGWHFSHYDGPDTWEVIVAKIPIGFHFGRSDYTKLRHMDDDNRRMQRGQKFDETFPVVGPGIFIFDVSDWSNDCNIEAVITVDGKVYFSTSSYAIDRHGSNSFNLNNWHNTYGSSAVRQTDKREIAFPLD
jgi:hypothetical protein